MGIFSTMMWNAIHMATHGLTTVNKRVETLKSCRRHAKGVVTKVISPLRLLVIILLLLKSNIQFHHECYRTIAALLAQQVVHHKLESDSLCHFHAEVIAYMFVKEMAHSLGFENTAFFPRSGADDHAKTHSRKRLAIASKIQFFLIKIHITGYIFTF